MTRTFTAREIAEALGVPKRKLNRRATRERWPCSEAPCRGGRLRLYRWTDLPEPIQAALLNTNGEPPAGIEDTPLRREAAAQAEAEQKPVFTYDPDALWKWAITRTQAQRDEGQRRAMVMIELTRLMETGQTLREAAATLAATEGLSTSSIRHWFYGVNGNPGAKDFARQDWAAALIPGHAGRAERREIPEPAWDWFRGYYLTRRQPTIAEAYRRTRETARAHGWGVLPSRRTFERRVKSDIPFKTRVYLREGPQALARLYPPQRRDKRVFRAGEAAVGDGLKFDRIWVRWPDGEVINTTTGWFWADLRSNYIAAYRLAKTENTDLFRLATYDLTGKFVPRVVWVDNTRVAAAKPMTAGAAGRHRGRDKAGDPVGLLPQLGIKVCFTNPDKVMGSPGAKPIERSFGIGGIHDKVATHPAFLNRGYSKKTAIPYEEFAAVVAAEVGRFNRQEQRRTALCRGVLSFEQAFGESFQESGARRLSEDERGLLLLMPEAVRADSRLGEIRLKAGRGPMGSHRYWDEALTEYKGRRLTAYYDPAKLTNQISVYTLGGRFVCRAGHRGDIAFHDTGQGREWQKNKARFLKASKKAAQAEQRMKALEVAALYATGEDVMPPAPGLVKQTNGPAAGTREKQEQEEFDHTLDDAILAMEPAWMEARREEEPW